MGALDHSKRLHKTVHFISKPPTIQFHQMLCKENAGRRKYLNEVTIILFMTNKFHFYVK